MELKLEYLNDALRVLERRVEEIAQRHSFSIRLQTFAPEPFEMLKEINVLIEQDGEDFNASFCDANVNASGCNEAEAIENLKENILSRFDYLDSQPTQKLSKPLQKQIAVLREFLRRRP